VFAHIFMTENITIAYSKKFLNPSLRLARDIAKTLHASIEEIFLFDEAPD